MRGGCDGRRGVDVMIDKEMQDKKEKKSEYTRAFRPMKGRARR